MSERQLTVLATPIFGNPLSPEQLARLESIERVRLVSVSRDGVVHGGDEVLTGPEVLLNGGLTTAAFDHLVARTPELRWIHSAYVGVDKVLTPQVRSRELIVTNARGVFSRPIAEYVVMMCLAVSRHLPQLLELQRERTWQPLRGSELGELTIGIVGFGGIGAEVARLLEPFGSRVIATRRHADRGVGSAPRVEMLPLAKLDELLRQSDVVLVAAPLTDETAGLIGARELQEMREHAWLINIARGRLVDEVALRRALEAGWIGGAVLDVFAEEPLPTDSPLYGTPNLIITPHTSWASNRVVERTIDLFAANLERYAAGEPLDNVVDFEAGY